MSPHSDTPDRQEATLVDLLVRRSADHPNRVAYTFLRYGEVDAATITYRELDRRARRIAAALRDRVEPGECALLLYPSGLEFVTAFLGCLYAGVVAVPAYPPDPARARRTGPRLHAIAADAKPRIALTEGSLIAAVDRFLAGEDLPHVSL